MKNYLKFMAWCVSSMNLSTPFVRMPLYLVGCILGSMAFGSGEHWAMIFSGAIILDLICVTIAWKYEEFKREQRDSIQN